MLALEEIRSKLDTTENLFSVVKTMKALSAVSIQQSEVAVRSLREFRTTIERGLYVAVRDSAGIPAQKTEAPARAGIVVFGSDYGLCGRFNDEIVAFAEESDPARHAGATHWTMLPVGARVAARLSGARGTVAPVLPAPGSVTAITESVQAVLWTIDGWRAEGTEVVWLVHHRWFPGARPVPHVEQLWPVDLARFRAPPGNEWASRSLPTFTMDRERLLSAFVRRYLFATLYRAFAESLASEHASRLAAMQAAEHNIEQHLEELRADFARTRQEAITSELLDIVGGFEALTGARDRGPALDTAER